MNSPVTMATGSVMNEVTRSFDSAFGSPVTSLSITDYDADLALLSELLIPLLEVMLLKPAPVQVRPNSRSCHAKGHFMLYRYIVKMKGVLFAFIRNLLYIYHALCWK